jgi:hypothetical protein
MKLTPQLYFNESELNELFTKSLQQWCYRYQSGLRVRINCNSSGQVYGTALLYLGERNNSGKEISHSVTFSHDVIAAGICQALAAKGEAIAPASLTFKYNEGHGYGGSSSISATASQATAGSPATDSDATMASAAKAGVVNFPGTVSLYFGIDELLDLLKDAVRRSGNQPTYASFLYTDSQNCGANISVTTKSGASGNILLNSSELKEALSEELTVRGYTVTEDGFRYNQSEGGYGSRYGTSMAVTCTAIPMRN